MNTLPEVPRDRWKRPLIQPVGGGRPEPYTRCTTYVGALEDTYNLEKWKCRQTAIGMSMRPDLAMAISSCDPVRDKSAIDAHVETAMEAASSHAAANIGTALHKFTEQWDREQLDMVNVPFAYRPDIEAYRDVMNQARLTVLDIETFVVNDAIKVGGTFDRVVEHAGKRYVLDVKTGSLDYGMGKIAMQLAVYAHSRHYNPDTFERADLDVDLERAIVAHLPAGQGKCFLRWVDIATGWDGVQLAARVRDWRKLKNLSEPFEYARVEPELTGDQIKLMDLIGLCATPADLTVLWRANEAQWTPAHSAAAKIRKTQLTEGN